MARHRFLFICNPTAGAGRSAHRVRAICTALEGLGATGEIRHVGKMGESRALAAEMASAGGYDVIVAVGGDGTVRQIAEGLHGSDAVMAILPLGTANVLVRELGQPRMADPDKFARFLVSAPVAKIFPGEIIHSGEKSLFLSMASVGPDSETVAGVSLKLKSRLGAGAYAVRGLAEFLHGRRASLTIKCQAGEFSGYWMIASRSRFYGGRFKPGFTVRATKPALETLLFSGDGFFARAADALSLAFGSAPRRVDSRLLHDDEIEVAAPAEDALQADGDIICRLPARIRVSEQPISVLVRK